MLLTKLRPAAWNSLCNPTLTTDSFTCLLKWLICFQSTSTYISLCTILHIMSYTTLCHSHLLCTLLTVPTSDSIFFILLTTSEQCWDLRRCYRSQSSRHTTLDDRGSTSAHLGRQACQVHLTHDLPPVSTTDSAVRQPLQRSHLIWRQERHNRNTQIIQSSSQQGSVSHEHYTTPSPMLNPSYVKVSQAGTSPYSQYIWTFPYS